MAALQRQTMRLVSRVMSQAAPAFSLTMTRMTPMTIQPITMNVRAFSKKADKNDKKGGKGDKEGPTAGADEHFGVDVAGFKEKMAGHLTYYTNELSTIKVGRPAPEQLQDVSVEWQGKRIALKNLAQVYVKPPQSLVVSVFEPSDALDGAVRQAIANSNKDLNPVNEIVNGMSAIVVPFPKPTREVRDGLIKQAKTKAEDSKTHIRQVRKLWMDQIKKKNPPKDDLRRLEKDCQTATDKFTDDISNLCTAKEKEINNA